MVGFPLQPSWTGLQSEKNPPGSDAFCVYSCQSPSRTFPRPSAVTWCSSVVRGPVATPSVSAAHWLTESTAVAGSAVGGSPTMSSMVANLQGQAVGQGTAVIEHTGATGECAGGWCPHQSQACIRMLEL
eukprot:SAG31_NODE_4386_length_3279_cov_1.891824_2_plen_129_part_00